jgi:hypothetical protein
MSYLSPLYDKLKEGLIKFAMVRVSPRSEAMEEGCAVLMRSVRHRGSGRSVNRQSSKAQGHP